jgi:hypothetical protein
MAQRVTRTGSFELPLDPADAIGLFTAEGERGWIPGWVPEYPEDGAVHDAVGTVFIRRDQPGAHTFVVLDSGPLLRRYARLAGGLTAGTVEVRCEATRDAEGVGTLVRVTFDLTALSPAGAITLDAFGAGYDAMMTQWRDWIVASARRP